MFGLRPLRRTFEAALRDAEEKSAQVRASAIVDLTSYAEQARDRVVAALERALRDTSPQVRSAAALSLADIGGKEALASLLFAVEDDDAHVRQMALTAVGEIGDGRARERLRRALGDERPEVRFQAVIAFARIAPDESEGPIVGALSDADPHVRYIAVRTAEELADRTDEPIGQAVRDRMRSLLDDADPVVRAGAAVALARWGDRAGASVLLSVVARQLRTREIEDEAAAIELVGEMGLGESVPALETRAFGLSRFFRETFSWQAVVALARMGHPRAAASIARDLGSRSRDRRTMAVAAAGRAKLTALRARIEAMAGHESVADQDAVATALEALAPEVEADAEADAG
jgi:HEAT repeat protein